MDLNISIYIDGVLKGSKTVSTPCLIGRSKEAHLTVAHPAMSRKHCELYEDGGKLFLRDNSSLNGTLYKNEYVEHPAELQINDEFSIGELTFRISSTKNVSEEERQEIADRPTAVIASLDVDNSEDSGERPGAVTILQPPPSRQELDVINDQEEKKEPSHPANDPVLPKGGSKKISPGDVRINIK